MPDNRLEVRCKKRLSVRFGPEDPKYIGYTVDVSREGIFLESSTVFKEGVKLHLALETRDKQEIHLNGEVRWSKKYAARYSHKMKSGMGILIKQFSQGQDLFESFCPIETCINCTPGPDERP